MLRVGAPLAGGVFGRVEKAHAPVQDAALRTGVAGSMQKLEELVVFFRTVPTTHSEVIIEHLR